MRVFAVLVVAFAALAIAPAMAQEGAIVVDDDNVQCAKATHDSIQEAVQSAPEGAIIWVCPGDYEETVTVDKRVVLRGVHYGDAGQRCNNPSSLPDPTLDAILHVPAAMDARGFDVQESGVTISGFVVRDGLMGTGIYTSPQHSGYRIDRNVIEDNAVGIELHSNGSAPTVVTQNCIRRSIGMDTMDMGYGIWSHEGLINANIENNRFANNQAAAIDLEDEDDEDPEAANRLANVRIQRNESVGDASFLRVQESRNTTVTNNTIRDFGMRGGIVVEANNAGVIVTNTTLRNGLSGALQTFVDRMSNDEAPSTGVRFERNTAEAAQHGVELQPDSAEAVTILQNHIIANSNDGMVVREGNTENVLRQNHVRNNGEDGIHFENGTSGNLIEQNSSFDNGGSDCRDDDGGDTWVKNQGETSTPPGLCTPNGS